MFTKKAQPPPAWRLSDARKLAQVMKFEKYFDKQLKRDCWRFTEKAEARSRVLTTDELTAICAAWRQPHCFPGESEKWRDYRLELYEQARLMLLTAARKEEIETISAAAIDWRNGWLNLHSGKVGRSHLIPLSASAMALLHRRKGREPMFDSLEASVPHYCGKRIGAASGIPFGQHQPHGWTIHDFRRTAATWIESSGIPYSAVSAMLGHKRKDVTAIYTQADRQQLQRAASLLEKLCRDIDGMLDDLNFNGDTQRKSAITNAQ